MRVAILSDPPDLSAYVAEIFATWGLTCAEVIEPGALSALDPRETPVLVAPVAERGGGDEASLVAYAELGGTVICFCPAGELAHAAGLERLGDMEPPLRLRMAAFPAAGLAGEILPVTGDVGRYGCASEVSVLAYLSYPGRYHGEELGIAETRVGSGRILSFAFDLARCVLTMRQGDPDRAEQIPAGDNCARPCHLAAELGSHGAGWVPFADLLARLLVDLVRRYLPAPVPLFSHLPGSAPGILLYSGDEDHAAVSATDEELDWIAGAGGRMSLYIIPSLTDSTATDVARYRAHHDVGPHPYLEPAYQEPVSARVRQFEQQIGLFDEMFGGGHRTLRNHSTAWAGYLELVEAMARLGVRLDGNFFSGTYMRDREHAPYAGFGGAMPMRFCRPDGGLLDVYQQHTHMSDDVGFGASEYSFKLAPATYAVEVERIFSDITTRFHTPYAVCMHPGNWVRFSREPAREQVRQATAVGMPTWSFDQWLDFCEARRTWAVRDLTWECTALTFRIRGGQAHPGLRLMLPAQLGAGTLTDLRLGDERVDWEAVIRFREPVALVPIAIGETSFAVRASYRTGG